MESMVLQIATKPAIAPFSVAAMFVWLFVALLTIIQANTPPAAARFVLTKMSATAVASAPRQVLIETRH